VSSPTYEELLPRLRRAYDGKADFREQLAKHPWKLTERAAFGERLHSGQRLLEIGAGTGQDSAYFAGLGLQVVATDLSPAMVDYCRAKGLEAYEMHVLGLSFPDSAFDAAYSVNCLLHVPNTDLPAALAGIGRVLRPGGLCYLGMYGGDGTETLLTEDEHNPPRFFSWRTMEQLLDFAAPRFEVLDAHTVPTHHEGNFHALTLSARSPAR
jgi:SAM-dependent methyltransferase